MTRQQYAERSGGQADNALIDVIQEEITRQMVMNEVAADKAGQSARSNVELVFSAEMTIGLDDSPTGRVVPRP